MRRDNRIWPTTTGVAAAAVVVVELVSPGHKRTKVVGLKGAEGLQIRESAKLNGRLYPFDGRRVSLGKRLPRQ